MFEAKESLMKFNFGIIFYNIKFYYLLIYNWPSPPSFKLETWHQSTIWKFSRDMIELFVRYKQCNR